MNRVEAVRRAQEVVRRFRAAADARQLGHAVRLDVQLPAGLDDRGGDRIVAAAGAQRRDAALIVAARVADLVGGERRVAQAGLGDIGHLETSALRAAVFDFGAAGRLIQAPCGAAGWPPEAAWAPR